ERADAARLDPLDDELILAALRVHLDRAERDDRQPVLRLEANVAQPAAEQHGAQLRVAVLQREVAVPGPVRLEVRDLAGDPHGREALLDDLAKLGRQLGDRQDGACRAHAFEICRSAAVSVFFISIAIVIGPMPPGTGVIACATGSTDAKSTSPVSLPSSLRLTPTSITHAPRLTMSPVTTPARPAATQRMSARRV